MPIILLERGNTKKKKIEVAKFYKDKTKKNI